MITDVNVSLSRWPFRRLPDDQFANFVKRLQACSVSEAWAGSFDGMLHKDFEGVNARLYETCRRCDSVTLRPMGTVNPVFPDWQEDLQRCVKKYRMPGIRLFPNYHGYKLDHPALNELLTLADRYGLIVQIALRMEDTRMQHPMVRVPDVDVKPLPALVAAHPKLRLVLINALGRVRGKMLTQLTQAGQIYFEIGMLEGVGGVGKLLTQIPLERLLFGSHFPLFVLESAVLKLQESALDRDQLAAITRGNARRLLKG